MNFNTKLEILWSNLSAPEQQTIEAAVNSLHEADSGSLATIYSFLETEA